MDPHVELITLGVADLGASRRFYVEGLGWEPVLDLPEIVFLQIGHGVLLGLFPATELEADIDPDHPQPPTAGPPPFSLASNVGSDEEVDAAVAAMVAAGGTLLKAPQRAVFGGRHAYVADPDGFRWEIAHNPGLTFDADGRARFAAG